MDTGVTTPRAATTRTGGIGHVAVLTHDLHALVRFYTALFGAQVVVELAPEGPIKRHCLVAVGGASMLHLLEVPGVEIPRRPLFERGRLDHLALSVADEASLYALRNRLVEAGASSGEITDFGVALSVHFRDPAGMDAEITWLKHSVPLTEPLQGG